LAGIGAAGCGVVVFQTGFAFRGFSTTVAVFMSDLTDLYQSVILDHNKRPRNRGKLPGVARVATGDNPTCGDNCTVYLRLDGERIGEISFEGSGCAISQASASLMTTQLKGKTATEAEQTFKEFSDIVKTGHMPEDFNELAAFAGVHAYPARIKCATLAWHAALEALKQPEVKP
jgi:nitrogen fixation protein NifU and related proteins